MNPQDLKLEAVTHRAKAQVIYREGDTTRYGDALNHLYQAQRKDLYASLLEGREPGLQECIKRNPKRVIHSPEAMITTRHYDFTPRPQENHAIRKEEASLAKHRWKCKVKEKREEDAEKERLKQLEEQNPTDFKKNLVFKF